MSGIHWQFYVAFFQWIKDTGIRLAAHDPGRLPQLFDGLNLAFGELVTMAESIPFKKPFSLIAWAFSNPDPLGPFRKRIEALQKQFPPAGPAAVAA
jgi:hypothetical protein